MIPSVNVVLSNVPGPISSLCLQVGLVPFGLRAVAVSCALSQRTGISPDNFLLLLGGRIVNAADSVAVPGQRETFLSVRLRRALPGGKGGFGANLRGGNARGRSDNFGACRDLNGRRIRDVQRARRAVEVAMMPQTDVGDKRPREEEEEVVTGPTEVDVDEVVEQMDGAAERVRDDVAEGLRAAREMRKRRRTQKVQAGKVPRVAGRGDMDVVDAAAS